MAETQTVVDDMYEVAPVARPVAEIGDAAEDRATNRYASVTATLGLLAVGSAGRVALQGIPSVEPLLACAVIAGFYGGWRHGAFVGAAGFFATNFLVWGGQGPWTVVQVLGAGGAGAAAGAIGGLSRTKLLYGAALVAGVGWYELVVNTGSIVYTPWALATVVPYLVAAVPFAVIHVASTVGFGVMLYGGKDYVEQRYS